MRNIIAHRKRSQFFQRDVLLFGIAVFDTEFMVAFKNLMIGIAGNLIFFVNKSLVQRQNYCVVLLANILRIRLIQGFENIMKTLGLIVIGAEQIVFVSIKMIVVQIVQ